MVPLIGQHSDDGHICDGVDRVIDVGFRPRADTFAEVNELFAFRVFRVFARHQNAGAVHHQEIFDEMWMIMKTTGFAGAEIEHVEFDDGLGRHPRENAASAVANRVQIAGRPQNFDLLVGSVRLFVLGCDVSRHRLGISSERGS